MNVTRRVPLPGAATTRTVSVSAARWADARPGTPLTARLVVRTVASAAASPRRPPPRETPSPERDPLLRPASLLLNLGGMESPIRLISGKGYEKAPTNSRFPAHHRRCVTSDEVPRSTDRGMLVISHHVVIPGFRRIRLVLRWGRDIQHEPILLRDEEF